MAKEGSESSSLRWIEGLLMADVYFCTGVYMTYHISDRIPCFQVRSRLLQLMSQHGIEHERYFTGLGEIVAPKISSATCVGSATRSKPICDAT